MTEPRRTLDEWQRIAIESAKNEEKLEQDYAELRAALGPYGDERNRGVAALVDRLSKAEAELAGEKRSGERGRIAYRKLEQENARLSAQLAEQAEELITTQGERDNWRTLYERHREHSNRWFETCKRRTREWRSEKARADEACGWLERIHDDTEEIHTREHVVQARIEMGLEETNG